MMLTIHGLPSSVKYQELKALIKQKCNISQFILDNLVSEEDGTKKVRIGVADENEGSILFRNLDGYSMNGYRLRVQPVGKAPLLTTPKQANYDSRVNYEHRSEYSHQTVDSHSGSNRVLHPTPTSRSTNYPYQHGGDVPQQPKIDPYPQREVYIHNRQHEQTYGYQTKPSVPTVTEDHRVVEVRPHILRTVEMVSKSYQPSPQTYAQPQQKPVTIYKDNFQGPTQGYSFTQTHQPIQQSYQGRQDVTRSVWAQDQNKLQLAYGKPSMLSYDKSVYNEDRKFSHHSAENQQTRGLLKTPTNYDQPKYAHTSQITRMSPPRRTSSPVRRLSPDKRLISPQGRQDLRKLSPSRMVSPRRRMSPSRRSPSRKSPTANRRLISPPPRRSSPPSSFPRPYYEGSEKYSTRPSGPPTPQVRCAYEKQMAQNQYSGGYGSSSTQNRASLPIKSSTPWQATKSIYPRDSPTERDIIRHTSESKYQSGAKSAYPRDSSAEREIRPASKNKYQQGTKSTYRRDSPIEHNINKHVPENKYQHFDILSVKEIHHSTSSVPLKRSRSPVRRNRTPPRRSPRKQSPSHRAWAGDRQSSPVARCPPSPPSWTDRSRTEKEQPNVWQRNEELRQRDYQQKLEEHWKKGTGFVGSRDKYEDRSDLARRLGDGVPFEKYRKLHDESRRPTSPQHKGYYYRQEDDRERHGFKHKGLDRSEQVVKHHENYAKHPDVYSKHQEIYNKYPEQFSKRQEPFNKNQEHPYKRHEQLASRHRQFPGEHGQFPSHPEPSQKRNLLHPKHQGSFPERHEPLLKYEEQVSKYKEPLLKYEESGPKRQESLLKYADQAKKHPDSYARPLEQFTRHQERQETLPMRQDQYAEHRDDRFRSEEHRKQSEGYRYSSDNKRIDSRLGHFDDVPRYEANEAALPGTGFTELSKRAQDWAQGIGQYGNTKMAPQEEKKESAMDPQLRQKSINVITRKILARHNVKMKDERQKKISICLRKMIEKRVNNIIGKRNMNLLEIQHKFRLTYSVQDEEKMYFDAVAVYPPKRHNEDSGEPHQKVAKGDDRDVDAQGSATTVKSDQHINNVSEPITELKGASKNDERQELPTEHYELSPLMEKALHSEIDLLMAKIWKQFPDAPPTEVDRIVVDRYKNKCSDDLRYALGLNVAQRILNIHHPFYVKVQFSELPRGRTINGFVRKYNIGKFERVSRNKRTTAKNTFKGSVSSFRDFDRLCRLKQMEYDGVKVHVSSYYAFTKCPSQLKFNRITKEIQSETDPQETKDAIRSNSESESVNQSVNTKDDPLKKEINIVLELKVEKEDEKKDENASGKPAEVASKLKSNEEEPESEQVKIKREVKIEEEENSRQRAPVQKEAVKKEETTGNQKVIEDEDALKKQKTGGKLNTVKENVTQSDLDEKEFEDILKNSIILDECIASDDD